MWRGLVWGLRDLGRIFWILVTITVFGFTVWAYALGSAKWEPIAGTAMTAVGTYAAIRALRKDPRDLSAQGLEKVAADLAARLRVSEGNALDQLLDNDRARIDVGFRFNPMSSLDARGAAPVGSHDQVLTYYQGLSPRRLAIIGPPGSGKTVMAIELQLKVLKLPRVATDPVAVRFSLSRWNGSPVGDWLAAEIVSTYQLAPRVAHGLVANGRVIPVLDGLDEMDPHGHPPQRAAAFVEQLNKWSYGADDVPLILTCRGELYDRLSQYSGPHALRGRRLLNAATVRLDTLAPWQVADYVSKRGAADLERWRPVIENLENRRNVALATALNTPWLLSLATTVYNGYAEGGALRVPGDLINHTGDMHEHLLQDYVRRPPRRIRPRAGPHTGMRTLSAGWPNWRVT